MIYNLCQSYHCLPSAILAESVELLRMHAVLQEGGFFADRSRDDDGGGAASADPFSGIEMVPLG